MSRLIETYLRDKRVATARADLKRLEHSLGVLCDEHGMNNSVVAYIAGIEGAIDHLEQQEDSPMTDEYREQTAAIKEALDALAPGVCYAEHCARPIPRTMLMCRTHWFDVPVHLRNAITRNRVASVAWAEAALEARRGLGEKRYR